MHRFATLGTICPGCTLTVLVWVAKKQKFSVCNRHFVAFDLSRDIGSTPIPLNVPGAAEYAIPAKPVPQLLAQWNQLASCSWQFLINNLFAGIVGGGAGVELSALHAISSASNMKPRSNNSNIQNPLISWRCWTDFIIVLVRLRAAFRKFWPTRNSNCIFRKKSIAKFKPLSH